MALFMIMLKMAKVCPVYKNGDKTSINNYYRPNYVLPSFSKTKKNWLIIDSPIMLRNLTVNLDSVVIVQHLWPF